MNIYKTRSLTLKRTNLKLILFSVEHVARIHKKMHKFHFTVEKVLLLSFLSSSYNFCIISMTDNPLQSFLTEDRCRLRCRVVAAVW